MQSSGPELFDIDWGSFDPWRICPVKHRLTEHPLLRPDQLIELGKRLERKGRVRTHSNSVQAGTSFNNAPELHPNRKSAAETLSQIHDAKAWMSLLNVQTDEVYRRLVDEVLDDLKPQVDRYDPGMSYRAGWIFVTSPKTITPFHMDKEHNFIMQIRGTKTLHVWEPDDTEVLSEQARDLFHAEHDRDLVVWRETSRARAKVFHLEPGMGAYMPSTSPHLVENGDGPSITMSFTYYTDSTRRDALLHSLHQRLRNQGLQPAAVGAHPRLDAAAYAACRSYLGAKRIVRRALGQPIPGNDARYAQASIT
jgi:hypothetical protein